MGNISHAVKPRSRRVFLAGEVLFHRFLFLQDLIRHIVQLQLNSFHPLEKNRSALAINDLTIIFENWYVEQACDVLYLMKISIHPHNLALWPDGHDECNLKHLIAVVQDRHRSNYDNHAAMAAIGGTIHIAVEIIDFF